MQLRELKVGDRFYVLSDKKKAKWVVRQAAVFNSGHGSSTVVCQEEGTRNLKSKSGRLEVFQFKS